MNQLQGKLKIDLFVVAKNFFPLFFCTGSNFDICHTQITCFFSFRVSNIKKHYQKKILENEVGHISETNFHQEQREEN